jgi:hypothetical protein
LNEKLAEYGVVTKKERRANPILIDNAESNMPKSFDSNN